MTNQMNRREVLKMLSLAPVVPVVYTKDVTTSMQRIDSICPVCNRPYVSCAVQTAQTTGILETEVKLYTPLTYLYLHKDESRCLVRHAKIENLHSPEYTRAEKVNGLFGSGWWVTTSNPNGFSKYIRKDI